MEIHSLPLLLLKILPSDQKKVVLLFLYQKIAPPLYYETELAEGFIRYSETTLLERRLVSMLPLLQKGADNLKGEVLVKEIETALVHAKLLVR